MRASFSTCGGRLTGQLVGEQGERGTRWMVWVWLGKCGADGRGYALEVEPVKGM